MQVPGATSTCALTGQAPPSVRHLAPGPGHGCAGAGIAVTHVQADHWHASGGVGEAQAPLFERPAAQVDATWYALRRWDEAGFRHSTSMDWKERRSQTKKPDAAAWQALAAATVTLGTVAVSVRIDNAGPRGVPLGRMRRVPPTVSAPPRRH